MTCLRWPWKSIEYFAVKITNCSEGDRKSAQAEVNIFEHISKSESQHIGRRYVRVMKDSFTIQGPHGQHICLALEPMRQTLWTVPPYLGCTILPAPVFKPLLQLLLLGLDFLHSDCHIIHTGKYLKTHIHTPFNLLNCEDLKADNFMLVFEEDGVIDDYVKNLDKDPSPCEERDGRPIYASRPDFGPLRRGRGRLKISDFGRAVFGNKSLLYYHKIQPVQFSAPEVLLKAGWTYSADIWNMGMVVSTLTLVAFLSTSVISCEQIAMASLGACFTTRWNWSGSCRIL